MTTQYAKAQFQDYYPLENQGPVPPTFQSVSYNKVNKTSSDLRLEKDEKRRVTKSKEAFLFNSNYLLDRLLLSGKVVFNDPVGIYVNQVAAKIYQIRPDLKDQIEIYVVKSSKVNAFTTQRGVILITLGMIAQLENEAQLAYVLCHEMIHFQKDHGMKKHLHDYNLKNKRSYGYQNQLLVRSNYSKENEYEADREGFAIYEQLGYQVTNLDGVFRVLQYSYLPFDEIAFDYAFLESKHLKIPKKYQLTNVSTINTEDEYDDSKSSHPNVKNRMQRLSGLIDSSQQQSTQIFLVSKNKFVQAQRVARFELSRLLLADFDLKKSLYNTFLLSELYGSNLYTNKMLVKSLYTYSRVRNNFYGEQPGDSPYEDVEGESQRVFYLLEKMSSPDLAILATLKSWESYLATGDQTLKTYAYSSLKNLIIENDKDHSNFFKRNRSEVLETLDTLIKSTDTKYEKIEKKNLIKRVQNDDSFDFAFVDLFKNTEFQLAFDSCLVMAKELEAIPNEEVLRIKKVNPSNISDKNNLSINKFIALEPFYSSDPQKREDESRFSKLEIKKSQLRDLYRNVALKTGLKIELISNKEMNQSSANKFNELSILSSWIREWTHTNELDDYINSNTEYLKMFQTKYKTNYILWSGYDHIEKHMRHYTTMYFVLFDMSKNQEVMVKSVHLQRKDRIPLLNRKLQKIFEEIAANSVR